jgi:hypothetical protein
MPSPTEAPEIEHSRKTKKTKEETNLNTHGLQFCQQVRERGSERARLPAWAPSKPAIKRALKMGVRRHRRASLSICFLFFGEIFAKF